MVSHPETGSDPPIGSDQELGCDIATHLIRSKNNCCVSGLKI